MKVASSQFGSSASSLVSLTFRTSQDSSQWVKKKSKTKKLSLSISQKKPQNHTKSHSTSKKLSQPNLLHKSPIQLHSKKAKVVVQQQKRENLKKDIRPPDHIKPNNSHYPKNNHHQQINIWLKESSTRAHCQKIVIAPSSHCNPVKNKKKGLKTRKNVNLEGHSGSNYFYQSKQKQIKTQNTKQSASQNTSVINKASYSQSSLKSPYAFDIPKGQLKLSKLAKSIYSPTPHSNQSSLQSNVVWKHQYNHSPVHKTQPFELEEKNDFSFEEKLTETMGILKQGRQKIILKQVKSGIMKQGNG